MKVHVGNHNANGDGYTFRETDDWSGVPGNTIVKSFHFQIFQHQIGVRV